MASSVPAYSAVGATPSWNETVMGSLLMVQRTVTVRRSGHVSPSERVTVTVAGPAEVHVSVGSGAVALLRVPEVVVHSYVSSAGAPSGSLPVAESCTELPTFTSSGRASSASMLGQTLKAPFTRRDPLRGRSLHWSETFTFVVPVLSTSKSALPLQVAESSRPS